MAVVTDSTAYLIAADVGDLLRPDLLSVVPLTVVVDENAVDEDALSTSSLIDAFRARRSVTTTSPAPRRFASAYAAAAAAGATDVVSVHLSGALSGTVGAAEIAARGANLPVHVVDSRLIGMGLGFCVLRAVARARDGATAEAVAAGLRREAALTSTFFYVATLEHLRRGGRIGHAQALLGAALSVKPLLELRSGEIEVVDKVRTAARAVARLRELATAAAGAGDVEVAVQHLDDETGARVVAEQLQLALPAARVLVREVGAVVGAHVGPGLLAVAVAPR